MNNIYLTKQEQKILKGILMGKSNPEMANDLFISSHTSKAHVSNILRKFQLNSRVELTKYSILLMLDVDIDEYNKIENIKIAETFGKK